MVWGRTSSRADQRERGDALTAAYHGPRGIPHVTDEMAGLGQTGRRATKDGRAGSRGGAPIWVCKKGWEPEHMRAGSRLAAKRALENRRWAPAGNGQDSDGANADPDGFAVFGRFPKGFLDHVVKAQWLGRIRRDEILHVCSGTLSETEKWTVDVRAQARPRVHADGKALPFRAGSFKALMLDPPYSDEYARNLYGIENPRPSWLLKEAARVVVPGGRIGILHVAIPFAPPDCFLVTVWPVTMGVGFRIRALTIYERHQDGLFAP